MNLLEIPAEKQKEILHPESGRKKREQLVNNDLRSLEPVAEEDFFDSVEERLEKKTTDVADVPKTYFRGEAAEALQKHNSGLVSTLKAASKKDDMSSRRRGHPIEGSVVLSASELTQEKSLERSLEQLEYLDTQGSQIEEATPMKSQLSSMPAAERNPRQSPLTNERVKSPAGAAHDRSTLVQQSTGFGEPWAEGSG